MRDKQEKNNQIADPPLLNAIKKGKAKAKQNKTLALARKERANQNIANKKRKRRSGLCLLKCKMEYHNVAESIKRRQRT